MNYIFDGAQFVENIKKIANETIIKQICNRLAGLNEEYGSVRVWQNKFTDWKNGKVKPYADDLLRIASVYGCSVDDLLGVSSRSSSASSSTYDLLTIVDAMLTAGIAKIDICNDGTEANLDLIFPDEDDLLEFIKVCNIKIYNKKLVDMLENYIHVTDLKNNGDLGGKMLKAIFDHEKERNLPIGNLSPDDVELSYTTVGGKPFVFE